jgi:hypothetical protein
MAAKTTFGDLCLVRRRVASTRWSSVFERDDATFDPWPEHSGAGFTPGRVVFGEAAHKARGPPRGAGFRQLV